MATSAKYSRYYTYIKPVTENPFVKSTLPYIFSLVAITIFTIFAIKPTVSTILNLQKTFEENQKVLDALNEKSKNLSLAKQNLDQLDPQIKQAIELAIPNQPSVTTLLASLKISQGNQASSSAIQVQPVTLYDANPRQKTADFNLGEVPFSFSVQGQYLLLMTILENILKSPRIISIDSVVISKQPDETPVMLITGKAYYLK